MKLLSSTLVLVLISAAAALPIKRGILDGALNNLDLLDHISIANTNINSEISDVENRNANTDADGDCDNSVITKRKVAKLPWWRRGLLDGALNNLDLISHISIANTNVDSDEFTAENRNANTKASGKCDNSIVQGSGHHHHHDKRANDRKEKASAPPSLDRRGILDGSLNNADIIDHISLLNSNVNSDSSTAENRNANTVAKGDCDNSIFQGGRHRWHKRHKFCRRAKASGTPAQE
ncbi:uncharacterized protein VTP21DRAFT_4851 [Calcarisporiella thermophila]|uniref:uncharacterized protein n=1 Tax=Calcarisporiella thermophila TaxID=911321 RepID=UPI003742EE51